jgi:hypothetical protein
MSNLEDHNFGNDGARSYLAMLTAREVATISAVAGDETRLPPEEDGESMMMPSVEVLALLCERYNAEPPRPDIVQQWATLYLEAFDRSSIYRRARPGFKAARRKVIENTFRWLQGLADIWWENA